jgi:hypothetical protein
MSVLTAASSEWDSDQKFPTKAEWSPAPLSIRAKVQLPPSPAGAFAVGK